MSKFIHWESTQRKRNLPDYEEEVFLTIRRVDKDKKGITIGTRAKTDKDGEHWNYITPEKFSSTSKNNIEVIAWSEKPDPYNPS